MPAAITWSPPQEITADSRLVIIMIIIIGCLFVALTSCCEAEGERWRGFRTSVTRPSRREGLNDSATIIVSTEGIIDGVVGGKGSICAMDFFFFLFFRGWLIVGRGVGGRFSRWFSKGVEIKFFCSCGRLKGGMDSVNLLGDFLILKLCRFNFQSGVEGREFWGCNFSIVYSLMKLWCDYSNIFLKRARYFKVRGYSRIYNYKQFIL